MRLDEEEPPIFEGLLDKLPLFNPMVFIAGIPPIAILHLPSGKPCDYCGKKTGRLVMKSLQWYVCEACDFEMQRIEQAQYNENLIYMFRSPG